MELRAGALVVAARPAGELATHGGDRSKAIASASPDIGLHRNQAADFVLMAEHPDIVEQVIAASSDASPPARLPYSSNEVSAGHRVSGWAVYRPSGRLWRLLRR